MGQTVGHPFYLLLGQSNSAIKVATLYCPGRSVEMPWATIEHFYKATLALKLLDLNILWLHICTHKGEWSQQSGQAPARTRMPILL